MDSMENRPKRIEIYKHDKWNMLHVDVQGKQLTVREISDQWGEETHRFLSRPEMMSWVHQRFSSEQFKGSDEEREQIISIFQSI